MNKKTLSKKFSQNLLKQLEKKQNEVMEVQPQTVGPLTPIYKNTTHYLKVSPWKILIPVSLLLALFGLKLLGPISVRLVSVLQQAF